MESVLLAALGGVLGVAIAAAGIRLLPRWTPDLPRLDELALDYRALAFIVAVTTLSGLLAGLPQAWRRARLAVATGLSAGSNRTTASASRHVLRDLLVVGQVAMAVVLMAGSGLLVRSFLQLRDVDPGFDPRGVLVAPIFLDSQAYNTGERTRRTIGPFSSASLRFLASRPSAARRRCRQARLALTSSVRCGPRARGPTARSGCPRRCGW